MSPRAARLAAAALLLLLPAALHAKEPGGSTNTAARAPAKIQFDLAGIDAAGLRGPPDGKRAVSYEFLIPGAPGYRREAAAIDSTLQFMPGAAGRSGGGAGTVLCIGSTNQKNWRAVLLRLAERPYIARIIECHFE